MAKLRSSSSIPLQLFIAAAAAALVSIVLFADCGSARPVASSEVEIAGEVDENARATDDGSLMDMDTGRRRLAAADEDDKSGTWSASGDGWSIVWGKGGIQVTFPGNGHVSIPIKSPPLTAEQQKLDVPKSAAAPKANIGPLEGSPSISPADSPRGQDPSVAAPPSPPLLH